MTTTLNHDEYQFVAGGELLAERGLLPYRDYPFLHMPYMVFANALVFRLTEVDFLAARLLTAACGLASAGLLFHFVFRLLRGQRKARSISTGVHLRDFVRPEHRPISTPTAGPSTMPFRIYSVSWRWKRSTRD